MFENLVKYELEAVNKVIRKDLGSQIPLINTVGEYIIAGGGKRIRPLLTVFCGKMLGNTDALLYKMAAMIEYIHTATLLHDDVVDESGLRRGRATANAVFGNASSVLVGDFIYTRAFQLMVESSSLRVLKIMADSTNVISEGEVMQMLNIGRSDLGEAEYFKVIESKTARLFEAGARVAGIISKATPEEEDRLASYAISLGTAFQIVDDILDYSGNSEIMGKNVGDDLQQGKVTLPLIYLLTHANADIKEQIILAINNPEFANSEQIVDFVLGSNSLTYCKNLAYEYVALAKKQLQIFPDNQYKQALLELVELGVKRIN